MTAEIINKYKGKSIAQLTKRAQTVFNSFIRQRDSHLPCISCKTGIAAQAGHFYSAGHYSALRFNEDNCNGQCVRCNYFLSGNLNSYRIHLEVKIGPERLLKLDELAAISKRNRGKGFDRFTLIDIIEKFKLK